MSDKVKPHRWFKPRWSKQFCQTCGLMALKNDASSKLVNKSCPGDFYVSINDPTAMKHKKEMR